MALATWAVSARAAITCTHHASVAGTGSTTAVNTTSDTLLIAFVSSQTVSTTNPRTDLDNKVNSWTRIGTITNQVNDFNSQTALYYVSGTPTVGSGHTFSDSSESAPSISFLGCSATATSGQLDGSNFSQTSDLISGGSTSSITPSANNYLVVTGMGGCGPLGGDTVTVSSPYASNFVETLNCAGGVNYSNHLAFNVQTTATATSATWSWTSATRSSGAHIAAFKDSGGAVTPKVCQLLLLGVGGC